MTRRAAAVLVMAGCLSRPSLVPKTFSIDGPAAPGTPADGGAPVLELRPVEVAAGLDGPELVYRLRGHRLERDPYAALSAPPAEVLTEAIQRHLGGAGVARSVVEAGSAIPADWVVEVHAVDLVGDFTRPDDPAGVLVLQFRVRPKAGSGAPILEETYASRRRLPHRTASAVVAAWNDGLAEIMRSFTTDLERALSERRLGRTSSHSRRSETGPGGGPTPDSSPDARGAGRHDEGLPLQGRRSGL